jgi:hypothetical protein
MTRDGEERIEPGPGEDETVGGVRFGKVFVEAPGSILREVAHKGDVVGRIELTNFWAKITAETVFDDGAERTFTVPAADFATLDWVDTQLGALAVIGPGATNRLVCAAIKERSIAAGTVRRREVFAHLGWRKLDGRWLYLTGTGALGAEGLVEGVEVQPPARLKHFRLEPGDARAGMIASLELLLLAPPRVTVPLWAAAWRPLFGSVEGVLWLAGKTGVFKSELAALAQQHYGRGMDARHLPQNWASTANDIEATLFAAKDALAVVDDFAPGTARGHRQELEGKAERVVRGLGNAAGRGRMTADGRQRPDRPPRAQAIVTGENLPAAHSIRARALIVPIRAGEVDQRRLTAAQGAARRGLYEHALAGFVMWLAGRYEGTVARWCELAASYRAGLAAEGGCTGARRSPRHSSSPGSRS